MNVTVVFLHCPKDLARQWREYGEYLGIDNFISIDNRHKLEDIKQDGELVVIQREETNFFDLQLFLHTARAQTSDAVAMVELTLNCNQSLHLLREDYTPLQTGVLDPIHLDGYQNTGITYFKSSTAAVSDTCTHCHPQAPHPAWQDFKSKVPALFLDRDGVINRDKGYVSRWEDVEIVPEAIELIKAAKESGRMVFVLTNQSGIARGMYQEEDVKKLHLQIDNFLASSGADIDAWYYCPQYRGGFGVYARHSHHRKPNPGMALEAEKRFAIDRLQSAMVGDKESDQIRLPGLKSYLLKGNYQLDPKRARVFASLEEIRTALLG